MNVITWNSKIGWLTAKSFEGKLTHLEFAQTHAPTHSSDETLVETVRQLNAYFDGNLKTFDLPLNPQGTPFQKQVWNGLLRIPFGETWSYKTLAEHVERPQGFQAVGQANGKNPIAIIIPCHRVVNANGQLGGYAGGLDKKKMLLKLEGSALA